MAYKPSMHIFLARPDHYLFGLRHLISHIGKGFFSTVFFYRGRVHLRQPNSLANQHIKPKVQLYK
jgi:hypothetical protein